MGDKSAVRAQEARNRWLWGISATIWIVVVYLASQQRSSVSLGTGAGISSALSAAPAADRAGGVQTVAREYVLPEGLKDIAQRRIETFRDFLRSENTHIIEIRSGMPFHRCLDVQEGNRINFRVSNARVQLWTCSLYVNQRWVLYNDSTVRTKLDPQHCLDVIDSELRSEDGRDFVPLQMFRCAGAVLRRWRYNSKTLELRTKLLRPTPGRENEEFCMFSRADSNGASVGVASCDALVGKHSTASRQWILA